MKKDRSILDILADEYTDKHSLREGEFTINDYMAKTGASRRAAFNCLAKMVADGKLERRDVSLGYANTYAYREVKKK